MRIPSNLHISISASLLVREAHFYLLTYTGGEYILSIIYNSKVLRGLIKTQALLHSLKIHRDIFKHFYLSQKTKHFLLVAFWPVFCLVLYWNHIWDMPFSLSTDSKQGIKWNFSCISVLKRQLEGQRKSSTKRFLQMKHQVAGTAQRRAVVFSSQVAIYPASWTVSLTTTLVQKGLY